MQHLKGGFIFSYIFIFCIITVFGYYHNKHKNYDVSNQPQDIYKQSYASEYHGQEFDEWRKKAADAITEIQHSDTVDDATRVLDRQSNDEVREGPYGHYDHNQQQIEYNDQARHHYGNENQDQTHYEDYHNRQLYEQQRREYEQRLEQERLRYEQEQRRYEEEQKRYEQERQRYEEQESQQQQYNQHTYDQQRYDQQKYEEEKRQRYEEQESQQQQYNQHTYDQQRYDQQKYEEEKQRYYEQHSQNNVNQPENYQQQYNNKQPQQKPSNNEDNAIHSPYYPPNEHTSTDEHHPITTNAESKVDHKITTSSATDLAAVDPNIKNIDELFKSILSQFQSGFPSSLDVFHNPFPSSTTTTIFNRDVFGGIALTDSAIFDVLDENSKQLHNKHWWKGPHVCMNKSETNDAKSQEAGNIHTHLHTSSCEETEQTYTCTTRIQSRGFSKTVTVTYQCCHGYRRKADQYGCNQVQLNDLVQTATLLGAGRLLQTIDQLGLSATLQTDNFTLFAPNDAAFTAYEDANANKERPAAGNQGRVVHMGHEQKQDMRSVVLGHISRGFLHMSHFTDDQMIPTVNGDSSIRINIYKTPMKVITADCAKVLSVNNDATNGIIHLIDRVISPATQSIMDIITRDNQFSMLKTVLSRAGMVQTLRSDGKFTVFAPTDAAFAKLNQGVKDRLFRDNNCLMTVLKSHVLPNVLCSTVIQGHTRAANMQDKYLLLNRDQDNKIFINDIQIVRSDIIGTNGVIHIIDGVIIPEEAKTITMVAEDAGVTEIVKLLDQAGIKGNLEMFENITFFAPSNDAIRNLPPSIMNEMKTDPRKLREIVLYHVTKPQLKICDLRNNQALESYHGGSLIINEYVNRNPFQFGFGFSQSHITAGCATIISYDKQSCNGVMHIIDKVLTPSHGKILDIIAANRTFSTLRRLIRDAGLEEILRSDGPFTIFAPTDQAFFTLPEEELTELTRNRDRLSKILKLHVLPENLCCTGINQDNWFLTEHKRTLEGTAVRVHRDHYGNMKFANAGVVTCDLIANNGIVHVIDKVIVPIGF